MATDYTPNYNLDLYTSTDKPNLRDQYNAAMGKIDVQMKKSADDITNANANVLTMQNDISALESTDETHGTQIAHAQKTADDALSLAQANEHDISQAEQRIAKNEQELAKLPAQISNAQQTAEGAYSAASAAQHSADAVAAKFPIRASSIQAGAVTADKLDETSVHRLLTSMTWHRFDSTDASADNVGMVCPGKYTLKGWYVEELALLVIEQLSSVGSFDSVISDPAVYLPSYVPTPSENITASAAGIICWSKERPFIDWSGVAVTTVRAIGPKSGFGYGEGEMMDTFGTIVAVMRGASAQASSAEAYKAANGMVK